MHTQYRVQLAYTIVTNMGKSYHKIKRQRLRTNVRGTKNYLDRLKSKSKSKSKSKAKKANPTGLSQKAVMKWMKSTIKKKTL